MRTTLEITNADIQTVKNQLLDAGEDLADYPLKRIYKLIDEGFLDD